MSENVIELKNLTMKFGGVTALNEVNLVVKKGEILALIGPNGAGKTTVFNVITGVYKPTSGDVLFQGKSILGMKRHKITKLGIARTFQNIRLFGESTALENVVTQRPASLVLSLELHVHAVKRKQILSEH
jgi:branched-chain amino acid transport system ATP-binding protein